MSSQHPYLLLHSLAERSQSNARPLPAQVDHKTYWTGVGFSILGERLVAPMEEVAEILSVPATSRLPGVQSWVRGVANVRGRLLPLIDLEAFFGGSLTPQRKHHRVLVLEKDDLFTGLIVSEVLGMQHFPTDSYEAMIPESSVALKEFAAGLFSHNERIWTVFTPARLTADPRFINAAA